MTDLPEPEFKDMYGVANSYTADQMREYRNAALEEAAKVCEAHVQMINVNGQNGRYKECAAAIRNLKEQK